MLFNFNNVIKEVDASDFIYEKHNLLDNMHEIKNEYSLGDNKNFKKQYDKNIQYISDIIVTEIESSFNVSIDKNNFVFNIYYPRAIDLKNGIHLRIRAKDKKSIMLPLCFSDEETQTIINFVKKLRDGI
jgi:hypothetical protein